MQNHYKSLPCHHHHHHHVHRIHRIHHIHHTHHDDDDHHIPLAVPTVANGSPPPPPQWKEAKKN
eukprot:1620635-Amphidinium_carterae.1